MPPTREPGTQALHLDDPEREMAITWVVAKISSHFGLTSGVHVSSTEPVTVAAERIMEHKEEAEDAFGLLSELMEGSVTSRRSGWYLHMLAKWQLPQYEADYGERKRERTEGVDRHYLTKKHVRSVLDQALLAKRIERRADEFWNGFESREADAKLTPEQIAAREEVWNALDKIEQDDPRLADAVSGMFEPGATPAARQEVIDLRNQIAEGRQKFDDAVDEALRVWWPRG